jgi:isocitrate/isopropylmalate dehydrogenase
MIISVKKFEYIKEESEELFEKLIKDFNSKAKELKLKFKIIDGEIGLNLIKNIFFNFGTSIPPQIILFDYEKEEFYFYGGIGEEVSKEVIPILSGLKQKFRVEVI